MITIEIRANLLRAAQAVAQLSVKAKDDRAMLHGVFVDVGKHAIVATNGHTLVKAPAHITGAWNGTDSLILSLSRVKIPAKTDRAIITVNEDGSDIRLELPGTVIAPQLLTRIEGLRFPDWERIIVQIKGEPVPYSAIAFNPDYITVVGKVIGKHFCVGMQFFGDKNVAKMIKVLWSDEPELVHVVLPCRI